ncbi:MAG: hypothetical protein ISR90_05025 [Candidatus Marinimicrobia bacterium]|nr:hypothetical protein [Candidatus Neomarinimicrobiota bacterium]MBL7023398.1 hypothetical protein [Candidatus Neomarinimicrobiota bacterium]MBL7109779.1 hypothetical protein [Candidatus Neomarinimicrobiota bacterium]
MKKIIIFSLLTMLFAQSEQPYPPLDLISIPTAGTIPKGAFTLEMLLQKEGGLLPKLAIGLTDHFTLGMSFGVQNFIGDQKPIVNRPTPEVQLKYRMYEETTSRPAIVIGLNTQGRGAFKQWSVADEDSVEVNRYEQKALGIYLVASKNWNIFGNLGVHIGVSKNTWENSDDDDDYDFFFGIDKELNRSFSMLLEYDAAFNSNDNTIDDITLGRGYGYLNVGMRWTIAQNLMIELNLNNINKNTDAEYTNREVKIMYSETF